LLDWDILVQIIAILSVSTSIRRMQLLVAARRAQAMADKARAYSIMNAER
jgi:hypothetical protein